MSDANRVAAPRWLSPTRASRIIPLAACALLSCTSRGAVRLEPLGQVYDRTVWQTVELFDSAHDVQREFVRVGLIRVHDSSDPPADRTVELMQKRASELGANAIVLEEIASDASHATNGEVYEARGWTGVATAIRILHGRWGDRYWRYGQSPTPLEEPAPVEPPAVGWQRVQVWRGEGDQKTDGFSVPSGEWRVLWQASAAQTGNLEILVHRAGDDELIARIGQDGGGAGSYLGLAGGGTFYLSVRGEGVAWEVAVDTWASGQPLPVRRLDPPPSP